MQPNAGGEPGGQVPGLYLAVYITVFSPVQPNAGGEPRGQISGLYCHLLGIHSSRQEGKQQHCFKIIKSKEQKYF